MDERKSGSCFILWLNYQQDNRQSNIRVMKNFCSPNDSCKQIYFSFNTWSTGNDSSPRDLDTNAGYEVELQSVLLLIVVVVVLQWILCCGLKSLLLEQHLSIHHQFLPSETSYQQKLLIFHLFSCFFTRLFKDSFLFLPFSHQLQVNPRPLLTLLDH